MMIRLSQGTASVVGLKQVRLAAAPTTASIMVGENCTQNCAFCAQSRSSQAKDGFLSRVPWPEFPEEEALRGIARAYGEGKLKRACLQVVSNQEAVEKAKDFLQKLRAKCTIPLSISCKVTSLDDLQALLDLGVERIGLALDAAGTNIYKEIKGGSLEERLEFLIRGAEKFPGHISTHLIAGLGETEEELINLMGTCYGKGIRVGLFAFTPIRGTRLADKEPPALDSYRRVQVARFLLSLDYNLINNFLFQEGKLISFGLSRADLERKIGRGDAFRTSGCPDCNRPFYNERPGTILYNYPSPLTQAELEQALEELNLSF